MAGPVAFHGNTGVPVSWADANRFGPGYRNGWAFGQKYNPLRWNVSSVPAGTFGALGDRNPPLKRWAIFFNVPGGTNAFAGSTTSTPLHGFNTIGPTSIWRPLFL
jgi:hypothetical protein